MPTRPQLILATANPHKVEELRAILATALPDLELLGLSDLTTPAPLHEPDEIGHTFEHNAAIKALSYAHQTNLPCVADDSGLEIDALQGRPGVISSHYFNEGRTDGPALNMPRLQRDQLNNARVLTELQGVDFEHRTARFVCVMAVAAPHLLATFRSTFGGRIGLPSSPDPTLTVPRGTHGFGYDPLFLVAPTFTHTGAELAPDLKNRLSHRAAAAAQLVHWLAHGGLGLLHSQ